MYPNGGYSIPHRLNDDELLAFLERHADDARVQNYIATREPPYGVTTREGERAFLVWWPETSPYITDLVVIDATGMPIIAAVDQAPYESPDSSFVQETIEEVRTLAGAVQSTLNLVLLVAAAYLALGLYREYQRA